jgi:hypothetical protein
MPRRRSARAKRGDVDDAVHFATVAAAGELVDRERIGECGWPASLHATSAQTRRADSDAGYD